MKTLLILIKRNIKLFFKDKGMFFTSFITPIILLALYIIFLGDVYKESLISSLPDTVKPSESIINGIVGGEMISSMLSTSAVTIAFCSNFLMVQDKANGSIRDLNISPTKRHIIFISYFVSTIISTIIICYIGTFISFIYLAVMGFYLSFSDILLILLDVFLLIIFATIISSIINIFLSTQGQISAVGTIVSAGYGFLSGAYFPINSLDKTIQNIMIFLPGTYGTTLLRNHLINGPLNHMIKEGTNLETIEVLKDALSCNIYFIEQKINIMNMYLILVGIIILLFIVYAILIIYKKPKKNY